MDLGPREVAKLLGIAQRTVAPWQNQGLLPYHGTNQNRRCSRDYIETLAWWADGKPLNQPMLRLFRRLYELLGPPTGKFSFTWEQQTRQELGISKSALFRRTQRDYKPFYVTLGGIRFFNVAAIKQWHEDQERLKSEPKPVPPPPPVLPLGETMLKLGREQLKDDESLIGGTAALSMLNVSWQTLQKYTRANSILFVTRGTWREYPQSYLEDLRNFRKQYHRYSSPGLSRLHLVGYVYARMNDPDQRKSLEAQCRAWAKQKIILGYADATEILGNKSLNSWVRLELFPSVKIGARHYFDPWLTEQMAHLTHRPTSEEAADYLDIPIGQFHSIVAAGRLPYLTDAGGRRRYRHVHLEELAEKLDSKQGVRTAEACKMLGIQRGDLHELRKAGHVKAQDGAGRSRFRSDTAHFTIEEIDRVKAARQHYIVDPSFEWLEAYFKSSKIKVQYLDLTRLVLRLGPNKATIIRWRKQGLLPFYVIELFKDTPRPPLWYPWIYFERLLGHAHGRRLTSTLLREFRDQCVQRGRLPLA